MKQLSLTEARAKLSTLVAEIDKGKGPIAIAQRSKVKAVLGPGVAREGGGRTHPVSKARKAIAVEAPGQHGCDRGSGPSARRSQEGKGTIP